MRAVVCGANGAMGKLICAALGDSVIGKVSIDGENGVPKTFSELGKVDADVVIDFSHHTAIADVLAYAKLIGSAAVIGTTGHTPEEKAAIFAAAEEILLRNRVPYGYVLWRPGEEPKMPPADDVLLVPGVTMLSDRELDAVVARAKTGGRLVVTGMSGRYDGWNAERFEDALLVVEMKK